MLVIPLITSCSISFYYNKLDWLVSWYLDDYVDLTELQQDEFDLNFSKWHQWHRDTQLVKYTAQLNEIKTLVDQEVSSQQVELHLYQLEAHWHTLLDYIAPQLSQQIVALSAQQKQELLDNIAQTNLEKRQDYLELSSEERLEKSIKRAHKSFKKWFGELSQIQLENITEFTRQHNSERTAWFEYRDDWQQAFSASLQRDSVSDNNQSQLSQITNLIARPYQLRKDVFQQSLNHKNKQFTVLLAEFINQASGEQKQHFIAELDDYIDIFESLQQQN